MADGLRDAQGAIVAAMAAFPDRERITTQALKAARALDAARAACPDDARPGLDHRLARKARELDAVLFEANAALVRAAAHPLVSRREHDAAGGGRGRGGSARRDRTGSWTGPAGIRSAGDERRNPYRTHDIAGHGPHIALSARL
jgi:hypothetical protein